MKLGGVCCRTAIQGLALLLLLLLALPGPAAAQAGGASAAEFPSLAGEWVGQLGPPEAPLYLRASFHEAEGGLTGTVSVPALGILEAVPEDWVVTGSRVRFALPGGLVGGLAGEALAFAGEIGAQELVGEAQQGAEQLPLRLRRLGALDRAAWPRRFGIYEVGPERFLWVGPFAELGPDPFLFDSASGRFAPLYPAAEGGFFSGPAVQVPLPPALEADFTLDASGEAAAITVRGLEPSSLTGARLALRREEVTFANGEVALAGTLTLPPGPGPHPAVVLLHGSGPLTREWFPLWTDTFARLGLAALAYDKRGTGGSGGDWKTSDFHDLAGDATAAFDLLRSRPDIDPRRIGLWGISQGGWIAPLVAAQHPEVAFVILHAGPATTVAEQVLANVEWELHAYELPEDEVRSALAILRLSDDFTRSGSEEAWARLEAAQAAAEARGAPWAGALPLMAKDDWFRGFYRRILDFDPAPYLEHTRCPLLAFFGERDGNVPAEENRRRMAEALERAGNRDHTLVVLPGTNHYLMRSETGTREEIPRLTSFEPRYFALMAEWLQARLWPEGP